MDRAKSSLLPPVVSITESEPIALETSILWRIEAANDAVEYGITIPVVPKIDIPPMIPNLGLSVFLAISSPLGTLMITDTPYLCFSSPRTSFIARFIIFSGVGLMAGLPISSPNPGLVTLPTPLPPSIMILSGVSNNDTLAQISAPLVTSGSSPPSLIAAAVTDLSLSYLLQDIFTVICFPLGSETLTFDSLFPFINIESAALVVAAAQVPVVNPVLSELFLPLGILLSLVSSALWNIYFHFLNDYFSPINNNSISS